MSGLAANGAMRTLILPALWIAGGVVIAGATAIGAQSIVQTQSATALYDAYYVEAHWHFAIPLLLAFAVFGLIYLILPRLVQRPFSSKLGILHFGLTFAGALLLLSPGLYFAMAGPPRRFVDYPDTFAVWNTIGAVGYGAAALGLIVFLGALVDIARRRIGA